MKILRLVGPGGVNRLGGQVRTTPEELIMFVQGAAVDGNGCGYMPGDHAMLRYDRAGFFKEFRARHLAGFDDGDEEGFLRAQALRAERCVASEERGRS